MIRFGVLGAGRIGKVHAATIAANPKAKLAYVAMPFPRRRSNWRCRRARGSHPLKRLSPHRMSMPC